MATTSEQLPALAETQSKIPWYVQDLPLYLKGFGILTVIYIGLRLYQGAFAVSSGLDSSEPAFEEYWMRLFYIELVVHCHLRDREYGGIYGFPVIVTWTHLSRRRKFAVILPSPCGSASTPLRCIGPVAISRNRIIPGIRSLSAIRLSRPIISSSFISIFRSM